METLLGASSSHRRPDHRPPSARAGCCAGRAPRPRLPGLDDLQHHRSATFRRNWAVIGEYLLWDILAQLASTGHAVHPPLPITEALRIPSAEEIAEAQTFGRQWNGPRASACTVRSTWGRPACSPRQMVDAGRRGSRGRAGQPGRRRSGCPQSPPLLYVLKGLGSVAFERCKHNRRWTRPPACRQPLVPTDMRWSLALIDEHLPTAEDAG